MQLIHLCPEREVTVKMAYYLHSADFYAEMLVLVLFCLLVALQRRKDIWSICFEYSTLCLVPGFVRYLKQAVSKMNLALSRQVFSIVNLLLLCFSSVIGFYLLVALNGLSIIAGCSELLLSWELGTARISLFSGYRSAVGLGCQLPTYQVPVRRAYLFYGG